ncbi:hypothetical protein BCR32DRAFT_293498 [Anaeromyces robustus]|uniref:Uncharacterized protein n=1 Tax=Anaeromyces robustus TaxID=1754192 RepID=A0A1Y1X5R6_9FUNG|nr:hypothetical protein BCR32DRAFT_293498 [Anaeromyces robustus]|eukprot:ORX81052.1 hypothetical protein BCR32DRAFT_293498 [Anaeromyces robustus]
MPPSELFDELEFTRISARTNIYSSGSVVTINKNHPLIFTCSSNGKLTCLAATRQANWKILETKLPGLLDHQEVISFDLFQTHSKEEKININNNNTNNTIMTNNGSISNNNSNSNSSIYNSLGGGSYSQNSNYEKKYFIVFGVTFCQTLHTADKEIIENYSFSIYETPWEMDKPELSLSKLGLRQSMPISFIPYKLAHSRAYVNGKDRMLFLLCGGDKKIRAFYKSESSGRVFEVPIDAFSPMLLSLNQITLDLQIEYFNDRRYIVAGNGDGMLHIGIAPILYSRRIDIQNEKHYTLNLFSPISSLHIYTTWTVEALNQSKYTILKKGNHEENQSNNDQNIKNNTNNNKKNELNLVVACGIGMAYVIKSLETIESEINNTSSSTTENNNVTNSLIKRKIKLPESDKYNTLLCCTSMDVDFDGRNEILIGSYSQDLLVYKENINIDDELEEEKINTNEIDKFNCFEMIWQREFAFPLYDIYVGDFNMDGLLELVIITMFGIHILQYNLEKAKKRCLYILRLIDEIKNMKEVLEDKLVIPKPKTKSISNSSNKINDNNDNIN